MGNKLCPSITNEVNESYIEIWDYYKDKLETSGIQTNPTRRGDWQLDKLAIWLEQNGQQFEDRIYHYSTLMPEEKKVNVCWKRIKEVYPWQVFHKPNWQFQYEKDHNKVIWNRNFMETMLFLKRYPRLLEETCSISSQICNQGFYRFFFYLKGEQKGTQIIIDDFIPLNKEKRYFFDGPRPGDGVWMILLQKALAKVLKSYMKIETLTKEQIFSEITGYPCLQLYENNHHRITQEVKTQPNSSKYFRLTCDNRVKLILCLWFPLQLAQKANQLSESLIVQLIEYDRSIKIPIRKLAQSNMIAYGSSERQTKMIEILSQNVLIHVFNRASSKIEFNLVLQTDDKVFVRTIKSQEMKDITTLKTKMLVNEYLKVHQKILPTNFTGFKVRTVWLGHRGIFSVKNTTGKQQKILFLIKQQFRSAINFEDEPKQTQKEGKVKPNGHAIFVINREKDHEYGAFYSIYCSE